MTLCLPLSPFMWVAFAGLLGFLSPFVSLCPLYVGGLCRLPERLVFLCFPLSPFGLCRFLGVLSAFVSLGLPSCRCGPPFVSLNAGRLCRVPGRLVSLCLPLSPFMWVAFAPHSQALGNSVQLPCVVATRPPRTTVGTCSCSNSEIEL